jgi:polyisoprenoid-binding protein YceI
MKAQIFITSAISAMLLVACGPSEAEMQAAREQAVADSLASVAAMERIANIDGAASTVKWHGTMLGIKKHYGNVTIADGTLAFKGPLVTGGNFTVDLNTIRPTDDEDYDYNEEGAEKNTKSMLTGHLKSADFFDVANHPRASFEIIRVEGSTAYGNLTVRGRTHEEKVTDIRVSEEGGQVTASGTLVFDRQKYGVSWSTGVQDAVLSDNIELEITLVGSADQV